MTILIVLGIITLMLALAVCGILLLVRSARATLKPCYRCGVTATTEYMALPYCVMCRVVVIRMLPAVRHDPPYGFPGSPGYTDFSEVPNQNQFGKKEI